MKEDQFLKWLNSRTTKSIDLSIVKDKYMEFNRPIEDQILKFIKLNPNKPKEQIAKYMYDSEICSRPTTLKVISVLIAKNLVQDNRGRKNSRSLLAIGK